VEVTTDSFKNTLYSLMLCLSAEELLKRTTQNIAEEWQSVQIKNAMQQGSNTFCWWQ